MRKASRQKGLEWALEVFDKAPYVTVSMTRTDGTPYGCLCRLSEKIKGFFISTAPERARNLTVLKSIRS